MRYLILILLPLISFSQSDVPDKYWLDDGNFEEVINGNSAFGDDDHGNIFWPGKRGAACIGCFSDSTHSRIVLYVGASAWRGCSNHGGDHNCANACFGFRHTWLGFSDVYLVIKSQKGGRNCLSLVNCNDGSIGFLDGVLLRFRPPIMTPSRP